MAATAFCLPAVSEWQILNPRSSSISLDLWRNIDSPVSARSSSSGRTLPLAKSKFLHPILNHHPSAISWCSRRNLQRTFSSPAATRSSSFAKYDLLDLIADQERGVRTEKRSKIIEVIDELAEYGKTTVTTNSSLSGTWRMLWTTEKEQLFIIKNANIFGTKTGDVLQVIDAENGLLNNVITFPPSGVFFVRSTCEPVSAQRVNFRSICSIILNISLIGTPDVRLI